MKEVQWILFNFPLIGVFVSDIRKADAWAFFVAVEGGGKGTVLGNTASFLGDIVESLLAGHGKGHQ